MVLLLLIVKKKYVEKGRVWGEHWTIRFKPPLKLHKDKLEDFWEKFFPDGAIRDGMGEGSNSRYGFEFLKNGDLRWQKIESIIRKRIHKYLGLKTQVQRETIVVKAKEPEYQNPEDFCQGCGVYH